MTAFMTIFGILAVLALGLTFIEKDIFNLVGFAGCALVTWVMYTLRKSMISRAGSIENQLPSDYETEEEYELALEV